MMEGLAASASGLSTAQTMLGVYANNLANLQSAGYLQENPVVTEGPVRPLPAQSLAGATGAGASLGAMVRINSGSQIQQTGNPMDVAIKGPGFFAVQVPGGKVALTRNGAFVRDAQGQITTSTGLLVLNSQGKPITVPTQGAVHIGPGGAILVGGKATGQILGYVSGADLNLGGVSSGPSGTLIPALPTLIRIPPPSRIVSGALDSSQVSMIDMTIGLMRAQRAYQGNIKALETISASTNTVATL